MRFYIICFALIPTEDGQIILRYNFIKTIVLADYLGGKNGNNP
jgi:hypothetical protein